MRSISVQTYKNIEVIISDDSPGTETRLVAEQFPGLNIRYHHNKPARKSPANWNFALDQASGELLMLLHQDDWLHTSETISQFVNSFNDPKVDFVFCKNIGQDTTGAIIPFQDSDSIPDLQTWPDYLVIRCVIGPPSNVMVRREVPVRYDEQLIWLVDVDYYIRLIKSGHHFEYLKKHLVTIGIHEDQTTEYVRSNNAIILKENVYVLNKIGAHGLRRISLYDYYWRLMRNFGITSIQEVTRRGVAEESVPPVLRHMIDLQKRIPPKVLKFGAASKSLMAWSYFTWHLRSSSAAKQSF